MSVASREHETPLAVVVERDGVEVMAFNREETFAFETVDDVSGLAREGDNTVETFNSHGFETVRKHGDFVRRVVPERDGHVRFTGTRDEFKLEIYD